MAATNRRVEKPASIPVDRLAIPSTRCYNRAVLQLLLALLICAPAQHSSLTLTATLAGKPVRADFYLLEIDPTPEFRAMPASVKSYERGLRLQSALDELRLDCGENLPEIAATYEKYVRRTLTTGRDGKAVIADVKPGKYYLFGRAGNKSGCAIWLIPVDLKSSQTITLNRDNTLN